MSGLEIEKFGFNSLIIKKVIFIIIKWLKNTSIANFMSKVNISLTWLDFKNFMKKFHNKLNEFE